MFDKRDTDIYVLICCTAKMDRCTLEQLRRHVLLCLRCSWGHVGGTTAVAVAAIGNVAAAASEMHLCASTSFATPKASASGSGARGADVDKYQTELLDLPGALPAVVLSPRQQRALVGAAAGVGAGAGSSSSASERRNSSDVADLRAPSRKLSKPMIVTSFSEEVSEGATSSTTTTQQQPPPAPAAAAAAPSRVPFVLGGGHDEPAADAAAHVRCFSRRPLLRETLAYCIRVTRTESEVK